MYVHNTVDRYALSYEAPTHTAYMYMYIYTH